jgi:hypothetical protein
MIAHPAVTEVTFSFYQRRNLAGTPGSRITASTCEGYGIAVRTALIAIRPAAATRLVEMMGIYKLNCICRRQSGRGRGFRSGGCKSAASAAISRHFGLGDLVVQRKGQFGHPEKGQYRVGKQESPPGNPGRSGRKPCRKPVDSTSCNHP